MHIPTFRDYFKGSEKINDSFQNLNLAKINFKVRASVFCFSKERAQTRAQAARSFLEGLKPASPRTALIQSAYHSTSFSLSLALRVSIPPRGQPAKKRRQRSKYHAPQLLWMCCWATSPDEI